MEHHQNQVQHLTGSMEARSLLNVIAETNPQVHAYWHGAVGGENSAHLFLEQSE